MTFCVVTVYSSLFSICCAEFTNIGNVRATVHTNKLLAKRLERFRKVISIKIGKIMFTLMPKIKDCCQKGPKQYVIVLKTSFQSNV